MADRAISVVVTCYNLERYIGASIRSVLEQAKVDAAVEVIVVDDCSTDRSADVIREFPVRYLRTPANGGVLLAMIAGIEAASHDRIALLDGDDLWEPGKLAATLAAFDRHPATALVTHDLRYIDGEGMLLPEPSRVERAFAPLPLEERDEAVRAGILGHSDHVWLGSALSVSRFAGRIDEFIAWARALPDPRNTYQDWPLAYWVAALPEARMAYVDERLFRYRLHGANHSGDARTAERALRNFRRARTTVASLIDIAERQRLAEPYRRAVREEWALNDYYVKLYSGQRLGALRALGPALPALRRQPSRIKEVARLAGIGLLGPDRFAAMKARGADA